MWNATVLHGYTNAYVDTEYEGETKNGVKVTLPPHRQICRSSHCRLEWHKDVYVWHKGSHEKTKEAKRKSALQDNVWLLRNDWQQRTKQSGLVGREWLEMIADI